MQSNEEIILTQMYNNIMDTYDKAWKNYISKKESIMPLLTKFYDYYKANKTQIDRKHFLSIFFNICYEHITDIPESMFPKLEEVELKENASPSDILDYIVYRVRDEEAGKSSYTRQWFVTDAPLYNRCIKMAKETSEVCEEIKVSQVLIEIDEIFQIKCNSHACNIINIGGEKFIVDCSYRQFCGLANRNLGVIGTGAKSVPGAFLMNTAKGERLASNLLRNGWIPCTPDNVKMYFDSFYLSDLSTRKGVITYSSGKTAEDYVSQINEYNKKHNIATFEISCQREPNIPDGWNY